MKLRLRSFSWIHVSSIQARNQKDSEQTLSTNRLFVTSASEQHMQSLKTLYKRCNHEKALHPFLKGPTSNQLNYSFHFPSEPSEVLSYLVYFLLVCVALQRPLAIAECHFICVSL